MKQAAGALGQTTTKSEAQKEIEKDVKMVETVDLRDEQTKKQGAEDDEIDDFDLLEATVDPNDLKTKRRVAKLEEEIEYEKKLITMKRIFKLSFAPGDPLNI